MRAICKLFNLFQFNRREETVRPADDKNSIYIFDTKEKYRNSFSVFVNGERISQARLIVGHFYTQIACGIIYEWKRHALYRLIYGIDIIFKLNCAA